MVHFMEGVMDNMSDSSDNSAIYRILESQAVSSQYALDYYCEPLYWYIKLFCKRTRKKMQDIARELLMDPGLLTKKLNVNSSQHRELSPNDIKQICDILGVSLTTILFLYENRNSLEDSPEAFDNFIKLKNIGLKTILSNTAFIESLKISDSQLPERVNNQPLVFSNDAETNLWTGKWYFYFPSSDSSIVTHRQKKYIKPDVVKDDLTDDEKELFNLYSNDHIFSGIITLAFDNAANHYTMNLRYMTNPHTLNILQYTGMATTSPNENAIFASLHNQKDGDVIYLIIDKLYLKSEAKYVMASVLTLSKNKDEWHQRPCSMRMIMSRETIPVDSPSYSIMKSNLMMNDGVIRIDDHGYGELKRRQADYSCPALDRFLELYPDISVMAESSNFITVHNCAYISEDLLSQLKDLSLSDKLHLEAILRLHSIASWYYKAKAIKTNESLLLYEQEVSNPGNTGKL